MRWGPPFGSGYPLQVLAALGRSGLSTSIPGPLALRAPMPRPTRSPGGPSRLRRDGLRGSSFPPLPFADLHHYPPFPPSAAPAISTKAMRPAASRWGPFSRCPRCRAPATAGSSALRAVAPRSGAPWGLSAVAPAPAGSAEEAVFGVARRSGPAPCLARVALRPHPYGLRPYGCGPCMAPVRGPPLLQLAAAVRTPSLGIQPKGGRPLSRHFASPRTPLGWGALSGHTPTHGPALVCPEAPRVVAGGWACLACARLRPARRAGLRWTLAAHASMVPLRPCPSAGPVPVPKSCRAPLRPRAPPSRTSGRVAGDLWLISRCPGSRRELPVLPRPRGKVGSARRPPQGLRYARIRTG